MKKLMIAAAIVCAAAFAQAANFNWGLQNYSIKGPDSSYEDTYGFLQGATAYLLIDGEEIASGPRNTDYTYGSFNQSASDLTGKVQTLADGNISESFVGQAYQIVLRTGDGKYEATIDGISGYKSVAQGAGQPDKNFETFVSNASVSAGDWVAVPEPTSGLLLLLGVAGLALRRRRA